MELSSSWEAANCAATRELPSILWKPEVHHCVHILSSNLRLGLSRWLLIPKFCMCLISFIRDICPTKPIVCDYHPNNIQCREEIMKLLTMQFCPSSCYFGVGIAQSAQRWGTGCRARVRFPARKNFYFLHCTQTGSRAHPASYPIGTEGDFPGAKANGTWS
jgi:hypothetical protein